MTGSRKRRLADVPPGAENPLQFALSQRDKNTVNMVAEAIKHKQVLLAFQPVMQARATEKVAFYEGLIRVLDSTGRVIPASDFMDTIENSELGRQLDTLALGLGLRALNDNPGLRLSIHMSAQDPRSDF